MLSKGSSHGRLVRCSSWVRSSLGQYEARKSMCVGKFERPVRRYLLTGKLARPVRRELLTGRQFKDKAIEHTQEENALHTG